jgi:formamidopyrimidine-DNA glycosylase
MFTLRSVPELPEVETVVRGLQKRVVGDVVESVWIGDKSNLLRSPAQEIARVLEGARISGVRRMGKHIVVDLETRATLAAKRPRPAWKQARSKSKSAAPVASSAEHGARTAQWIVHLGMTGKILVTDSTAEIEKHTHLIAQMASGNEVRFVDPRRFGKIWVHESEAGFATAGIEPLHISFDDFARLFRGRKTPIKSALLNQALLRGVGNIYADESLFRAGIRPRRRAASLTRDELHRLHQSVQQVLREAIAAGGSSVSDYVGAEGERGFFQIQHRVYGREGEPCLVCGTPIKRIVVAGRGTHYCPKCQK